ncbi:zinc-ribbon domain-containing protein [Natronomonas marina]|jgi:hypothetical protein|uniref:zinc-ribbon domain-containing protein n=1 Tax=Natronomonas marina TaxID=2961939 RepID=UPI0020C9FEEB|nr:zinc-ribbon domain-containing protein [Natronomonas marina]
MSDADPHCPECGEPIGQTATYCMHCSADLTEEQDAADADGDGDWDTSGTGEETSGWDDAGTEDQAGDGTDGESAPEPTYGRTDEGGTESGTATDDTAGAAADTADGGGDAGADDQLLDPDGFVDNTLTVLVGIGGGIVVGIVGTIVIAVLTGSGWGLLLGVVAWLGSTAYLVRQRTVQGAVAKSGYAVAAVLLLIPFVAFSPLANVDGGLSGRGIFFLTSLLAVAFPAGFAAAVGWVASRFVPEEAGETAA